MSEATSELEERLTRHRKLQNGMELILGKLKHDAKSITTEDAQSLADNAEEGDEWTANIIAAVVDIALHNEDGKAAPNDNHSRAADRTSQPTTNASQNVMERLRSNPGSITEEDACRFSENVEARDPRSARLVSAVESVAAAHNDIHSRGTNLRHSPRPSLLTIIKDLHAAVETNPGDVNTEMLRTTQSIVSKMQKAIGHTNAPHPEFEAELQQEYAKIVPRLERGIVTKAEADHLHSLEARAHGHTERGGLTAIAQSVAAKRERQASISSGSDNVRSCANSRTSTPHKQSHHDVEVDLLKSEAKNGRVQDAAATDAVCPREQRSHEKSVGMPSNASMRRYQSLSDFTNTTRGDSRYDVALSKLQGHSSGDLGGGVVETMPPTHKRENSHPAA